MSHLLASVNQEAADNIRPIAPRQPLPGVGELVVYTMRPGHGRNGRTRFPAVVMGEQGGKLILTVLIDAGDMVDESLVDEAGPGTEFHCWERVQPTAVPGIHGTVASLHERIGELEAQVKALPDVLYGDYDKPSVSFVHIMVDFENRLRVASENMSSLRKHLLSEPATDGPSPRAAKKAAKKGRK